MNRQKSKAGNIIIALYFAFRLPSSLHSSFFILSFVLVNFYSLTLSIVTLEAEAAEVPPASDCFDVSFMHI
jgi:hypothetical protein